MDAPHRSHPAPDDEAGAGRAWRPSLGYLAVALGIVAGALVVWLVSTPWSTVAAEEEVPLAVTSAAIANPFAAPGPLTAEPVAPGAAAQGATAEAQRVLPRTRDADSDPTPDLSDFVSPGEKPTMAEVIDRLRQAGVQGGLAAFPPPGTRPPLIGLAVPEDFVLPEGYVRHYQATDDGQRIEPILMFSPDYRFLDALGRPIAIPQDRVVPPELAPPGLPIRRIVVPAPTEAGRPGR